MIINQNATFLSLGNIDNWLYYFAVKNQPCGYVYIFPIYPSSPLLGMKRNNSGKKGLTEIFLYTKIVYK